MDLAWPRSVCGMVQVHMHPHILYAVSEPCVAEIPAEHQDLSQVQADQQGRTTPPRPDPKLRHQGKHAPAAPPPKYSGRLGAPCRRSSRTHPPSSCRNPSPCPCRDPAGPSSPRITSGGPRTGGRAPACNGGGNQHATREVISMQFGRQSACNARGRAQSHSVALSRNMSHYVALSGRSAAPSEACPRGRQSACNEAGNQHALCRTE